MPYARTGFQSETRSARRRLEAGSTVMSLDMVVNEEIPREDPMQAALIMKFKTIYIEIMYDENHWGVCLV